MMPLLTHALRRSRVFVAIATGLAATAMAAPGGAAAAGNAGYTTFDATLGGCLHGSAVNCNVYEAKQDVYMNGGPTGGNGLADGEYFFAVLAPGCQNGGFLDGKPGNLSDEAKGEGGSGCSDSGEGSGDDLANRTFTVSKGLITSYTGTHTKGEDPQGNSAIALFPFDDTPNHGGVYILAICPVGAKTAAPCKFDAFKVNGTEATNLTVLKDANPEFAREFPWSIEKSVNACQVTLAAPNGCQTTHSEKTLTYTVKVTKGEGVDSGWKVSGTITIFNPNSKEATGVVVADAITPPAGEEAGSCSIESGGSPYIVGGLGAGEKLELAYVCTFVNQPLYKAKYKNTATVKWDAESVGTTNESESFQVPFEFTKPTSVIHDSVSLSDLYKVIEEPAGSASFGEGALPSGTIDKSKTFEYTYVVKVPYGCVKLENDASFEATDPDSDSDDSGSAEVTARVCRTPAHTGALTMGFWQNKNGQSILSGDASSGGVCKATTWLRQYAPFQDLSATASCSKVASYVYGIIKVATCGGTTCNAMLKAQMLATALDVYFSDPALGTNKIKAPAPIGGVTIDLTLICQMIDGSGSSTCSGVYEDASSAFGGSSSLTVSQMLAYAASQSNAGGSTWYGQVKATQALAKDAFDAINNQVAFSI
jgi:hypothetical protein